MSADVDSMRFYELEKKFKKNFTSKCRAVVLFSSRRHNARSAINKYIHTMNSAFNYIAKNKITGLYFDGTAFNADQFHPHHITVHPAFFKATWDYNGNIELIDVLPIKPEYKIKNKRTGEKLVRSNGELGWSHRASGLKWNTRAGAEGFAKSLNNYNFRGVWEIIELTA